MQPFSSVKGSEIRFLVKCPGLLYLINYRTLANFKKETNGDCRWSYGLRMLMAYSKCLHS